MEGFMDLTLTGILSSFVFPATKFILIVAAGILAAFLVAKLVFNLTQKANFDVSLCKFLSSVTKFTIIIVAAISALSSIGIPTGGIIAAFSAAAVAVSLALKDSLSNISGGIFLLLTKPFGTGDVVELNGSCGSIKEIKLIHTVLLTFDGKEVIYPNSVVMGSTVTNLSKEDKRRVDLTFPVSYDSNVELAQKLILDTASKHELVISDPAEPFAKVTEHSDKAIVITARLWCMAADYWTVYFDVLEQVRKEFNQNNITIPYNQLDVHIHNK